MPTSPSATAVPVPSPNGHGAAGDSGAPPASPARYLELPPDAIVERGAYYRQYIDPGALAQLRTSVGASGEGIDQAIGVREVEEDGRTVYVLVYGKRRLHAARAAGLATVPVRTYGRISEGRALQLQMRENAHRDDPHLVDTAIFLSVLREHVGDQQELVRLYEKSKGWVSIMCRTGDALRRMRPDELPALYACPAVTYEAFRDAVRGAGGPLMIADRLRDVVRQFAGFAPRLGPPGPREVPSTVRFAAETTRGGVRRHVATWSERDVADDPARFLAAVGHFVAQLSQEAAALAGEIAARRAPPERTAESPTAAGAAARREALQAQLAEAEARLQDVLAEADARRRAVMDNVRRMMAGGAATADAGAAEGAGEPAGESSGEHRGVCLDGKTPSPSRASGASATRPGSR